MLTPQRREHGWNQVCLFVFRPPFRVNTPAKEHEAWYRISQAVQTYSTQDAYAKVKIAQVRGHTILLINLFPFPRNLVTSLVEHEQIQTTLAKAKEASRLAEKVRPRFSTTERILLTRSVIQLITLGKKGSPKCKSNAQGILLDQTLVPKVFQELALRYKDRQGGYTRINKFGRREGDNAPSAILELVDGPRDTLFEVTARAIGWEIMGHKLKCSQLRSHAMDDLEAGVEGINVDGTEKWLRPITRENIQKVLLHRGEVGKKLLGQKAAAYLVRISSPLALLSFLMNLGASRTNSSRSLMLTRG